MSARPHVMPRTVVEASLPEAAVLLGHGGLLRRRSDAGGMTRGESTTRLDEETVVDPFYAVVRVIARFWIWFFFERVEVRHPERVPSMGPVLLCINHPNNLIDSLLVGAVLPRKVHYLATAALFRNPLMARFLVALGVIPVYLKADDPDKVGRNTQMFVACHQTFDRGGLVAIYPGGRHPRGRARAADQDGRGSDRAWLRSARSGPPHGRAGRAQFRGPQKVPRSRPRLVRRAGRRLVVPRRLPRGAGESAACAHDGDPVGDGAPGRPRRAHGHGGARVRRGNALPR